MQPITHYKVEFPKGQGEVTYRTTATAILNLAFFHARQMKGDVKVTLVSDPRFSYVVTQEIVQRFDTDVLVTAFEDNEPEPMTMDAITQMAADTGKLEIFKHLGYMTLYELERFMAHHEERRAEYFRILTSHELAESMEMTILARALHRFRKAWFQKSGSEI